MNLLFLNYLYTLISYSEGDTFQWVAATLHLDDAEFSTVPFIIQPEEDDVMSIIEIEISCYSSFYLYLYC